MKRFLRIRRALAFVLVSALFCGNAAVFAASEHDTEMENAVSYLVHGKIYRGDENGNLNVDKGLTRAELAVILMRLDFLPGATMDERINEWCANYLSQGTKYSKFTDVPNWAAPHVEYCYNAGYMNGIGETQFDPSGQVNPKMVCTVVMRRYKIAEGEWNYDTSVSKAQAVKLTGSANVSGATILRGDTAIIFDRAMGGLYTKNPETPTPTPTPVPTTTPGATTAMTIEEMKAEIVRLTNVEREKAGLTPVEILPELMDCAQAKAQDMSDNSYFSHNSKKYGSADKMISSFVPKNNGTRENIAYTMDYYSAKNMFTAAWVASKEHYKNLTNPNMTHIGVGIADTNDDKRLWVMQLVAK